MGKQTRPSYPPLELTTEWQKLVEEELAERGWTRTKLAKELQCSKGAITGLLHPEAVTSRLVRPTCILLGIPEPVFEDDREEDTIRKLRLIRTADPKRYDRILGRIAKAVEELDPEDQ